MDDAPLHADDRHPHASEGYRPGRNRHGIALCLSGGGYRAALFHLGALSRLEELGVLSRVDTISSVSGGSILAAKIASGISDRPPAGDRIPSWQSQVFEPMLAFTRRNIRNAPLAKRYLLPWNWFRSQVAVAGLESEYAKHLTGMALADMPSRPRFIMSATDIGFGVNWVFDSGRLPRR